MKVDKLSISFSADLGDAVRDAAKSEGATVSGWLASAAAERLRALELKRFFEAWQAEQGPFSREEIAEAEAELRLSPIEE